MTPVALSCPLPSPSALPTLWLRWRPGLVLRVLLLLLLLLLLLVLALPMLLLVPLLHRLPRRQEHHPCQHVSGMLGCPSREGGWR